jgi:SAM-dependent methyltransferase
MPAQYSTAKNLKARMQIYDFAAKKVDWQRWVMAQVKPAEGEKILEVGCGDGTLWQKCLADLPTDLKVSCLDNSSGTLDECKTNLPDERFDFHVADASVLPFKDATFDRVVANHMLYHVADISQALREISRVLKPGGRIYAATNGKEHLHQLRSLARSVIPNWRENFSISHFELDTGSTLIAEQFEHVTIMPLDNLLEVTDPEIIVDYIASLLDSQNDQHAALLENVRRKANSLITQLGAYHIRTASGLISAQNSW